MCLCILGITYLMCDLGVNDYLPFYYTLLLYIDAFFDHVCDKIERSAESDGSTGCYCYSTLLSTCSNLFLAYWGVNLITNYEGVWNEKFGEEYELAETNA